MKHSPMAQCLRTGVVALLCGAATVAAHAGDDDLLDARNALHDKLYAVTVTHADSFLKSASGQPADRAEALQLLVQAFSEQHHNDDVIKQLDAWRAVAEAAPDPSLFAFWRSLALLESGHARESLAISEPAISRAKSHENADALRRVTARAKLAVGDKDGALNMFAELDRSSTNTTTRAANLLEWAGALEATGRIGDALGVLVRQVELNITGPLTDQGRLAYGRLLVRQGRTNDASTTLQTLANNSSAVEKCRVPAWIEVSHLALAASRTNDAITAARSAESLATQPEMRKLAAYHLADLLLSGLATLDEGVTRMKAFVRAYPEGASAAQFHLAEALLRHERHEAAAAEYRVFLETYNDREREADALAGLGSALFNMNHFGEAATTLQRAHDRGTNEEMRASCLFQAGDALHAAGQFRRAAEAYRLVSTTHASTTVAPRALFQAADSLERAEDFDGAQAAFTLATRSSQPDISVQALLRLASLQSARANVDQAIATYSSALATATNAAPRGAALMGRGRAHYRAYHFELAAHDFSAAQELLPELRPEAEYLRTLCLYGLGRDEESRVAAAAYVVVYTNSAWLPDMVLWLARYDFNRNRMEDAGKRFLEYVARWPQGALADAALLGAGRASFRRANYTQAVELMSRLQREYPHSPRFAESRFVQGDALCMLGRFAEAVLVFDEIINRYADSDWVTAAWGRKGDCLFSLGTDQPARYTEAIKAYREMLARRDVTPEMTLQGEYWIGRCYEKNRLNDLALDQYYTHVILKYQDERRHGRWYSEAASMWFVRAALQAAELLERKGDIEQAERILNRAIQENVPGQDQLKQRVQRLKNGHADK